MVRDELYRIIGPILGLRVLGPVDLLEGLFQIAQVP